MVNLELVEFIREARKRGFSDSEIRKPLHLKGWFETEIDEAFADVAGGNEKTKVCFYLNDQTLRAVEKRARKNLLTVEQQIEDIVRRSCAGANKGKIVSGETDDKLVNIFSRKKRARKKENKPSVRSGGKSNSNLKFTKGTKKSWLYGKKF